MHENSNSLVEYVEPAANRNDPFSSVSTSITGAHQYNPDLNRVLTKHSNLAANQTNLTIVKSEGIHVGDIVYHIHHHDDLISKLSRSNSLISSSFTDTIEFPEPLINNEMSENKGKVKKNKIILPVLIVAIALLVTAFLITFFILWYNKPTEDLPNTTEPSTTFSGSTISTDPIPTSTTENPYPEIPQYFTTRDEWGASPPRSSNIPLLQKPIKRIIIGHTGGNFCHNQSDCIEAVKSIQSQDSNLDDIPYNFLIGGDGNVYEGRGINYEGQHTENENGTEYNSIGIFVAFIGNYQSIPPTSDQVELLKEFIGFLIIHMLITTDYIIVSQDDLKYSLSKADALNEAIKMLPNHRSLYKIYRREEWGAQEPKVFPTLYSEIINWVLIGHTVTPLCNDLSGCMSRARSLQADFLSRDFGDIAYNIMFGGDGFAFEGRGWDYEGLQQTGLNSVTVGVGVIGDFQNVPPNNAIINAMLQVFDDARALGKLTEDYKIFGRSDFRGPGPGEAFMEIIRTWCRHGNRTDSCNEVSTTEESTTHEESTITSILDTTSTSFGTTIPYPEVPEYFVTRYEWGADPPRSTSIPLLELPIRRIIIGHIGGEFCNSETDCIKIVKSIQSQDLSLDDIPYNFLIGGDGKVYEGRGINYAGQHTQNKDATEYNSIGICIAFIGNYQTTPPSSGQIELLKKFIGFLVSHTLITADHIIVSQDDLKYSSRIADTLNEAIKSLPNYRPLYKVYHREEWRAQEPRVNPTLYNETMNWLLIGHTVTPLCNDLSACMSRARSLQTDFLNRTFGDIAYNIMFGGDGFAFEGRGWDYEGLQQTGLNSVTVGVGVIGDFQNVPPNNAIINAMLQVFDDARALGKLTEDYKIFGRSDFRGPGPGEAFMQIIRTWCRYGNGTNSC